MDIKQKARIVGLSILGLLEFAILLNAVSMFYYGFLNGWSPSCVVDCDFDMKIYLVDAMPYVAHAFMLLLTYIFALKGKQYFLTINIIVLLAFVPVTWIASLI